MQAKAYRANTIREATEKVKNVLGPEAMIISTTKLRGDNGGSLFEVKAVPGGESMTKGGSNFLSDVREELVNLREMIRLVNHSDDLTGKLLTNTELMKVYTNLIGSGIKDGYAKAFLERAGFLNGHPPQFMTDIREKVVTEVMNELEVKDPFVPRDKGKTIGAFVGTTGVGKTTTIAKIAARLLLRSGKRVGLISVDNYRIGAIEQLKIYANILGIPCFSSFNRKDLLFAFKRMESADVILIDTAGQSQYDSPRIAELREIMASDSEISCHLLLSVATSDSEMDNTATNFRTLGFDTYIFTKMDETERHGAVINQMMRLKLPVSYFTTGQSVPEDIERATKKKIVKLVLNAY